VYAADAVESDNPVYQTKLKNARGDLVTTMNLDESFMSDMMHNEVLSGDKKKSIQQVSQLVRRLFCVTGVLNTHTRTLLAG